MEKNIRKKSILEDHHSHEDKIEKLIENHKNKEDKDIEKSIENFVAILKDDSNTNLKR